MLSPISKNGGPDLRSVEKFDFGDRLIKDRKYSQFFSGLEELRRFEKCGGEQFTSSEKESRTSQNFEISGGGTGRGSPGGKRGVEGVRVEMHLGRKRGVWVAAAPHGRRPFKGPGEGPIKAPLNENLLRAGLLSLRDYMVSGTGVLN